MVIAPDRIAEAEVKDVVVTNDSDFGDYDTRYFDSDDQAVQTAFDETVRDPERPNRLVLSSVNAPFRFERAVELWQSNVSVLGDHGETIAPAAGNDGYLLRTRIRGGETEEGPGSHIHDLSVANLSIDGENQASGIETKDVNLSVFGPGIHIENTDGPGLRLSDGTMESQFIGIRASDNCGSFEQPAVSVKPDSASRPEHGSGRLAPNHNVFYNLHVH